MYETSLRRFWRKVEAPSKLAEELRAALVTVLGWPADSVSAAPGEVRELEKTHAAILFKCVVPFEDGTPQTLEPHVKLSPEGSLVVDGNEVDVMEAAFYIHKRAFLMAGWGRERG